MLRLDIVYHCPVVFCMASKIISLHRPSSCRVNSNVLRAGLMFCQYSHSLWRLEVLSNSLLEADDLYVVIFPPFCQCRKSLGNYVLIQAKERLLSTESIICICIKIYKDVRKKFRFIEVILVLLFVIPWLLNRLLANLFLILLLI